MADILTNHSSKSTGLTNDISHGCVPFRWYTFQGHGIVHAGSLALLTRTPKSKWNSTIVNVISNTCDLPIMRSQNVCCEKGL